MDTFLTKIAIYYLLLILISCSLSADFSKLSALTILHNMVYNSKNFKLADSF